jgi:hypothetical protein
MLTGTVPDHLSVPIEIALNKASGSGTCHLNLHGQEIPGSVVSWLLLNAIPELESATRRLELWNASIPDLISLPQTELKVLASFVGCTLAGLDLTDARMPGLEVIGGQLERLHANRLTTSGTILLRGNRQDVNYSHALPQGLSRSLRIPAGVLLCGANIHGNLDMRGALLGQITGLPDTEPVSLLADGVEVDGNVLLFDAFSARGEVRLNGARIQRNLSAASALLRNPHGYTLSIAGARVQGTLYLGRVAKNRSATYSIGTLRLEGARVEGDLDASAGRFIAAAFHFENWQRVRSVTGGLDNGSELDAIQATGLSVSASVSLSDGFEARGSAVFVLAQIGGDLICSGGRFDFPGEEAFYADGATIGGCSYFDRTQTNGLMRLVQTRLKQGCVCEELNLETTGKCEGWWIQADSAVARELESVDVCGVYAAGAEIGGALTWRRVRRTDPAPPAVVTRLSWLSAPGARLVEVNDDQQSWDAVTRIDLRDCTYDRITQLAGDPGWRLDLLDREYAPWNASYRSLRLRARIFLRTLMGERRDTSAGKLGEQIRRFAPAPYLQLARVYREQGLEAGNQRVLLKLERNRTNYGGLDLASLCWRWWLDVALKHGLAPFRPVLFVIIWIAISGALFAYMYRNGHAMHGPTLMSTHSGQTVRTADPNFKFNGTFYALDTLVPFVDFGQKKNVTVRPLWSWPGFLLLLNTIIGYAAAAFFAAGLSGLVRTGKGG